MPRSRARSGWRAGGIGGGAQVLLGHQVGVDVVVGDRAVLVGAGDPVDAEPAVGVVVAQRAPQPRGLGQQLQADVAFEGLVAGGVDVADDRVGDVGVDVEGGGAGRPVAGAFLAVDGAPREGRAGEPELGGALRRPSAGWSAASAARARRRPARRRSAPAARTFRCPRSSARRSRARSGPWRRSPGPRRGRRPAARGTARTAPPAGSRRRRRAATSARSQNASR